MRRLMMIAATLTAISAATFPAVGQPAASSATPLKCFYSTEFDGWRARDDRTIYIHVRPQRYFRLDLAGSCAMLKLPDAHLITRFRGSDAVCAAVDWDLQVAETPPSIPEPCIVKTMTELTPEEAAAIPKKFHP
jgi:hypothetical protein